MIDAINIKTLTVIQTQNMQIIINKKKHKEKSC